MADTPAKVYDLAALRLRRECVRWGATRAQLAAADDDTAALTALKSRLVRKMMAAPTGPKGTA